MSNILSEINRVREIMGLVNEQSNEEITVTFRNNPNIDTERVDKFSVMGSRGTNEANIFKNGEVITANVGPGGMATVTGVRAEGNNLIVDIDAPAWTGQGGPRTMGTFVYADFTDTYKFEPNKEVYDQLEGEDKLDFDAFIAAVEGDAEFARQILAAVTGTTDFITSEYGIEIASDDTGDDIGDEVGDIIVPSEEILAWAEEEMKLYPDDEEVLNQLKTDPVAYIKEELELYIDWNDDEGEVGDWQEEIDELEALLATLTTTTSDDDIDATLTSTTVTVTGTTTPITTGTTMTGITTVISGCTYSGATNYNPKATIDDGSCEGVEGYEEKDKKDRNIKNLKTSLKGKWKNEVFSILDNIQEGDIFGFNEVYDLVETDKLHAILKMLQNLMCINAKIARTVILAEDNVYDASKLMSTAQFPKGGGHEGLINTIESNIKRVDKKFKLFSGGRKVDAKLKPIKDQLKQARQFINQVEPYLNWNDVEEKYGFKATTTEEVLLNSKSLNKIHSECASQIK